MGEFIETVGGGVVWGLGFGLAMGIVRGGAAGLRPVVKGTLRSAVAVSEWVQNATAEGRETLQDLYHEAKAEQRARA